MSTKIECAYQDAFQTKQLFSNILYPPFSDDSLHRLLITEIKDGDVPYEYPRLFYDFPAKINWIIFSSDQSEGAIKVPISPRDRLLMAIDGLIPTSGHNYTSLQTDSINSLFYLITDNLQDLDKVVDSSLWAEGVGLALPFIDSDELVQLKEYVHAQLTLPNSLIPSIKVYKCAILSNTDGAGVSMIWADDWSYSAIVKDWAQTLSDTYPVLKGNPWW